ncbi:MAG: histidine phosphatase family protein [Neomegalonema sp.]|nr:histidine phosphatase family protein [Neomegalonema sp.]
MKRLILMRHAKSDWSAPGRSDHDRPLNQRGRLAAPLMGAWLAEQEWLIDHALISSALRTQQTWARLCPLLPNAVSTKTRPDLYECRPQDIAAAVAQTDAQLNTLLVVGHNPSTQAYAHMLCGRQLRFATAAIGVFELADWSAARGDLVAYEEPKMLV